MKYNKTDIVKHWGIRNPITGSWLVDGDCFIFAVTCPRVAEVQLEIIKNISSAPDLDNLEVAEIKPNE